MSVSQDLESPETGAPIAIEDSPQDMPPELLPLDAWHRARGGRMVPFAGYMMPVQYDAAQADGGVGIIAEHHWTRQHAGLFDVSHMGQLHLSGEGLDAALEAVLPIDLATLKPGAVRYSLLLDDNGGILDDLMVTRWQSGLYVVVNGATKWDDIAHLRETLPDAITISRLDEAALLALQGPEAFAALAPLVTGEQPLSALTFMRGAAFMLAGVEAWISRSGYTGEDGFEISIPAEAASAVADALCAQPQVRPIGLGARDSLRLEAGLPLYGHDLSPETDPVSAGLTFAISKRRRGAGGFPGAERILGLIAEGSPTLRVGLMIEGRMAAREGARVYAGDIDVGAVTSGGFSPSRERPIAMAYVTAAHSPPGSAVEIEVRGRRLRAEVAPMPFIPHHYVR